MPDTFTNWKRSRIMAAVRSTRNKSTEIRLIGIFKAYRISGWRRNRRVLGNPDFVFQKSKLVVFVDGCFWHGCPEHLRMPTSNREYWEWKIGRNKSRDRETVSRLRADGWRVLRVWEHELKDETRLARLITKRLSVSPGPVTMRPNSKLK
jgi:DNA mismatch endonuclease (patch repair protein)